MNWYKGFSPQQRYKSLEKTKEAIAQGIIPKPHTCNRCSQDKGIIHYHNADYSDPVKYLEMLCWRCHMMLHSEYRHPKSVAKYFKEINEGNQYPPVYKHDFKELDIHFDID